MDEIDETFDSLCRPVLEVMFIQTWYNSIYEDTHEYSYYEPITDHKCLIRVKTVKELLFLEKKYNVRVKVINERY